MRFEVIGEAVPKARPRFSRIGGFVKTYTPAKTENFENLVKLSYKGAGGRLFDRMIPLSVTIKIYRSIPKSTSKKKFSMMMAGTILPLTKPDLDNVAKSILDALNGVAYHDDSQVTSLIVEKLYSDEPKTIITIEEVSQDTPALPKDDESQ